MSDHPSFNGKDRPRSLQSPRFGMDTSSGPWFSSLRIIVLLPLTILILCICLTIQFGQTLLNNLFVDKVFHVLGGVAASASIAGVIWHFSQRKLLVITDAIIFRLLVFGLLCFVIICWEILEYVFARNILTLTYADTIFDLACSLLGGACCCFTLKNNCNKLD